MKTSHNQQCSSFALWLSCTKLEIVWGCPTTRENYLQILQLLISVNLLTCLQAYMLTRLHVHAYFFPRQIQTNNVTTTIFSGKMYPTIQPQQYFQAKYTPQCNHKLFLAKSTTQCLTLWLKEPKYLTINLQITESRS